MFHLYSDMSKFATVSTLYQIQNGQPKLIAYASKRLPEATRDYSITELELCGLTINIASFSHIFKKVDFGAIVDQFRAQCKTRKATCHSQTRKCKGCTQVKEEWGLEGKDLSPSINQLSSKQGCHRKFLEEQK